MRNPKWLLVFSAVVAATSLAIAAVQQTNPDPLPWAYGATPPPPGTAPAPAPAAAPDTGPKTVKGSTLSFTLAQVRDSYGPADWHPEDHGSMPEIVAHGRRPDIIACALCHYPNGRGRAENAGISGLPVDYFTQQMVDFKNGVRNSAEPRKANTKRMAAIAKAMTDEEIKASADYFASMKWTSWVKVVESTTAPKTRIAGGLFVKLDGNETEPLGNRIIEVPDDTLATETLRDDHSPFTAYVPVGSLKKGKDLVTTGGAGKTVACSQCHGTDMKGGKQAPPLAGRSPSYLARQLYDFQKGARKGAQSAQMEKAVAKLSEDDILNITAYLASLAP